MTFLADPVTGIEDQLRELVARGFHFVHPTGRTGEVLAIVGVRAHHDVVDVVCIRGEGEAKAARMPSDEADILAPTCTFWQRMGGARVVLTALLALPDDNAGPDATPRAGAEVLVGAN
jgi:hypothetical protein